MVSSPQATRREIRLEDALDIAAVRDLHAELKAALNSGDPIYLDGSGVVRADTAAMQALIAMFAYATAHNCEIELHTPSQALAQTAELLDVSEHIGLKTKNKLL